MSQKSQNSKLILVSQNDYFHLNSDISPKSFVLNQNYNDNHYREDYSFNQKEITSKNLKIGESFVKPLILKYSQLMFPFFGQFTFNDSVNESFKTGKPLLLLIDNLERYCKEFYELTISNELVIGILVF